MFESFPPASPVWVYAADRFFTNDELAIVNDRMTEFLKTWNTHGKDLTADFEIVERTFIAVVANESLVKASGCSIDSLVHCIKAVGKELSIDFFNRLSLLVERNGELQRIHFSDLSSYSDWDVFNTSVNRLDVFQHQFKVKVSESKLVNI
jgi:hypothetical protein